MSARRRYTFAVTDLHGRSDLFDKAADEIERFLTEEKAVGQLLFLGDYVDRGPDSRGCVERVMQAVQFGSATALMGNHEDILVKTWLDPTMSQIDYFFQCGGDATMRSYGWDGGGYPDIRTLVPKAHIEWMAGLPVIAQDEHRIYVHAGLMPEVPLERQGHDTPIWIRERFLRADPDDFVEKRHIVHGHTPRWALKPNPTKPEMLSHRTNLDTGAYATGVLSVGVFDADQPGGPLEVWSIQ